MVEASDRSGDEVTESIGGVVTAEAFVVSVELEDIGGEVRVMLEGGEAIDEATAALMDEEGGFDAGGGVAEAEEEVGPALGAVGVSGVEVNAQVGKMGADAGAVVLVGEGVWAGDELDEGTAGELGCVLGGGSDGRAGRATASSDAMAGEHFLAGEDMALGHPAALGVLIDDVEVVMLVLAGEEDDGVMGISEVHGGAPIKTNVVIEMGDDMGIVTEGFEELTGGDIPVGHHARRAFANRNGWRGAFRNRD